MDGHRAAAVASAAIECAFTENQFRVEDVREKLADEETPSRQTMYRVMSQLADDDWVRLSGHTYFPGRKPELLADSLDGVRERREDALGLTTEQFLGVED